MAEVIVTQIFRGLILISATLFTAVYWLPAYDSTFHSMDAGNLLSNDGFERRVEAGMLWGTALFILELLFRAMAYFFIRLGRFGLLLLWVPYPIINLWLGYRVVTPIEVVGIWWIGLLDGAILAVAYLTSVSQRFEDDRKAAA